MAARGGFRQLHFFCCARLLFLPRQDIVIALTTPPLISFIGAWRAKLWRTKFCYWVMDLNPDEAIAAGWLRKDSFTGKILERMSRFSFHWADWIVALDRFMRDRIAAKGISPEKIAVIPPWSHDDEIKFDALGREQIRKIHNLTDKFVVMYSGNHSPVHPLDTLMQAADILKGDPTIHFCFVGGGSELKRVRHWAAAGNHANVLCLPYQPLNELSASLSAADAQMIVMGNAMLGLVHPCKIYNILAVGAPVIYIGPQPSHVTEILDELGPEYPTIQVAHGAAEELARQIQSLRQKLRNLPRSIPSHATTAFVKSALLPKMITLLEK